MPYPTTGREPHYSKRDREWYVWDWSTRKGITDDDGKLRLFLTAEKAYDWIAANGS